MPVDTGPVPAELLSAAAQAAITAHATGRPCCGECTGGEDCDQYRWALEQTR